MATKNLTKSLVEAMKPGEVIFDGRVKGFGVRCQRAAKIYILKTRIQGRQRWLTIGKHGSPWTVEKARDRARAMLGEIAGGGDPATTRDDDRAAGTFDEFADRYLAEYAETKKKASSAKSDRSNLAVNIRPMLGRKRLTAITRADVARLHHDMRDRPGAANRCLSLLSKMFNLAERWGLRAEGSNPARHIERYPERKVERYLSHDELARLGTVLKRAETERIIPPRPGAKDEPREGGENPYVIAAVRLLLFTGARRSEILSAKWSYVDRDRGVMRLPDSKSGAKNIILGAPALAVLDGLPKVDGNPYILPGHVKDSHLVNLDIFWRAACKEAGIKDCRLHDLRHSFASVAVAGGDSLFLVGRLLGHSDPRVTDRYAHLAPDPAKSAADRISGSIEAIMGGNPAAAVVPLRRGKA